MTTQSPASRTPRSADEASDARMADGEGRSAQAVDGEGRDAQVTHYEERSAQAAVEREELEVREGLETYDPSSLLNSYPECEQCGRCCEIAVLALTIEEAERMLAYAARHHIKPRDNGEGVCPWRAEDNRCLVWEARSQTCRLHSCQKSRYQVLEENPGLHVHDEDKWLVDLRRVFLFNDFDDPRL